MTSIKDIKEHVLRKIELTDINKQPFYSLYISEIFPDDFAFKIVPTKLVDCLCGATRSGHFDGVALVLTKLFNIVNPDFVVLGEKDFQQVAIVKKLVLDLNFNIEIITAKTKREESGLAMSSRNQRLSESGRIKAAQIFKILNEIKENPKLLEEKKAEFLKIGFDFFRNNTNLTKKNFKKSQC
jgi:pantoate--beta-alanine ligase